ncbi:MAG: oligosaccharide flippase family protein [Planctomycetes bacterium]|nr:oligosaccharide flippase family protein [Planctomycetota bacterium]
MIGAGSDLRRKTLHSLFWQLLGVGGQRVVQFVGIAALWRIVEERDLGLFAILLSAIGVLESLTTFVGDLTSIWSKHGAERRYLDTVFTVRVVRSLLICSVLCALAWPFAWYFANPERDARYWLPGLFLLLAWNGLLDAFQSPARAAAMKGLAFRKVALGDFVAAMCGMGLALGLAVALRDVWALVLGHMASTAIRTATSYLVAPYRPRLRLDREVLGELFRYNKGAAGTPFLLLMIFTAPPFVIGKVIGDIAVALFDGAARLARLPEDIFLRVLGPVAMPAFAQLQHDRPRLARAWSRAVHAFLLVGVPMAVGLGWCGDALPEVVFGAKYVAVPGVVALLAVHGGLAGLTSVVGPLFWAIGEPHRDRRAQFCRCVLIYALGIPATLGWGIVGFAAASCVAIAVALLVSLVQALHYLGLRWGELTHAARDGLMVGLVLLATLVWVDYLWTPTGLMRVVATGLAAGPVLAILVLRLMRHRRSADAAPAIDLPPDVPVA